MSEIRIKGVVAYDGTDFAGWQSQKNGNAIQDILEKRLALILKKAVRIHGASRTDAGVHAEGQVFHFDAEWPRRLAFLERGMRSQIPSAIQVLRLEEVEPEFHARRSATGKRYVYHLQEGDATPFLTRYRWSVGKTRLDAGRMQQAAVHLLGRHDFSAFGSATARFQDPNPVKEIHVLQVQQDGAVFRIITEGSGYLYRMVRSIAGALVDVGSGRLPPDAMKDILESRRRTALVRTAPARGLCLERVFYHHG